MSTLAYDRPNFGEITYPENEAVPAFIGAAAAVLGVGAGYVVWVCDQCTHMECNSFSNTVSAVRAWWGDGC